MWPGPLNSTVFIWHGGSISLIGCRQKQSCGSWWVIGSELRGELWLTMIITYCSLLPASMEAFSLKETAWGLLRVWHHCGGRWAPLTLEPWRVADYADVPVFSVTQSAKLEVPLFADRIWTSVRRSCALTGGP